MAYIHKRTTKDGETSYRVQIRLKGYDTQSKTFKRKTDARKWAEDTESAMRQGRDFLTADLTRRTVGEMIDRRIAELEEAKPPARRGAGLDHRLGNLKTQQTRLQWWQDRIGHCLLAQLRAPLILEHSQALERQGKAPGTRKHYLKALSGACKAAKQWGWLKDNPVADVPKPKEPRGRVRFLSDEELERLLAACRNVPDPRLYPLVELAILTGARKSSELLNLKWQDIDWQRNVIILQETKNEERRAVPITSRALEILTALKDLSESLDEEKARSEIPAIRYQYVFFNPLQLTDHRYRSKYDIPCFPETHWNRAVKEAGLDDFHFHDLRHTAASYLAMSGATLLELATILGHKTLNMVKRYAHLTESHTKGVMERMNEKFLNGNGE